MTADLVRERDAVAARVDALGNALVEIDDRRAAIRGQIEQAQVNRFTSGEFADPDWFRRARGALRHLGVDRSEVCRDLGASNRRLRELNGALNRDAFRTAVREIVDPATWERIIERHEVLSAENRGAS